MWSRHSLGLALLLVGCAAEEAYQAEADLYRLRHLQYYGALIEEYHDSVGAYPFEGDTHLPLYAFIAHDRQVRYTQDALPFEHERREMSDFVSELEAGLGREINEYYDPQYVPTSRPNFYMYVIEGDTYFFAVHLHERFSFSQHVGERYNKIEISNRPGPNNFARAPAELFALGEFVDAISRPGGDNASMNGREQEYLHFTKRE